MKVVIVTQNNPYYYSNYLDSTLRKLVGTDVVVKKVYALTTNLPGKTRIQTLQRRLSTLGLPIFCYLAMLRLGYFLHDLANSVFRFRDRSHLMAWVCRMHGVPLSKLARINTPEVLEELRAIEPEIIFSLGSPKIFGPELLALPSKGCLNIHSSLLPRYRGVNPNFWVLANGEEVTGVTIHYMTPQIDAGDILFQERILIGEKWSLHDLYLKVIECGSNLIATCLKTLCSNTVPELKNEIDVGSYFSYPTREDVKAFRAQGRTFYKYY